MRVVVVQRHAPACPKSGFVKSLWRAASSPWSLVSPNQIALTRASVRPSAQIQIGSLLDQHHAAMVASLEALIDMVFADGKVKDMEVSTLANVIHVSRLSGALNSMPR